VTRSCLRFGPAAASALAVTALAAPARADTLRALLGGGLEGGFASRPLALMAALAVLALVPFVLIMVTSFVKIAVVLSILRQALGTQQIPPTAVITGLAVVLTAHVMTPVALETRRACERVLAAHGGAPLESLDAGRWVELAGAAGEPLRVFLERHARPADRRMFFELAFQKRAPEERAELTDRDWSVLVPAFTIGELAEAFQVGFILFVPFLVVDLVVANLLMALGMQMLSPTTISLPFKLLLFVLADGWHLVSRGLVLGYH
jgi:type III secretion protein R